MQQTYDAIVIGGGSAGLAAAVAMAESNDFSVLIIERETYLGGVLPQCVHDGFGLYCYGESLTGPEYARRWIERAERAGVHVAMASTVLSILPADRIGEDPGSGYVIDAIGEALGGRARLEARVVICATGCRERTRGVMQIPGGRPAGVLTAGSAQYMVNVANQLPGDKVVILGSGDIGLIMARRMVLEGAEVRMVLGQEATGLVRNHIRCIQDFGIPIRYGWGLAQIHGYGQLQAVTIAPLNEDGTFDMSRREYIRCNVLLIACGLIPEREVLANLDLDRPHPGLFVCGNAAGAHDLVDQVSQEGVLTGLAAASYLASLDGIELQTAPADLERLAHLDIHEPTGRMNEVHASLPEGMTRVVCTVCPTGCVMAVGADGVVTGNTCDRGWDYALAEAQCPHRLFTGTVRVRSAAGGSLLIPVRTDREVPRASLQAVARHCARMKVDAPILAGDVLCEDIAHTGARLVATDDRSAVKAGS